MIIREPQNPSELSERLPFLKLPAEPQLTVTVADQKNGEPPGPNQTRVLTAMNRLKGSGNGKLVHALLQARQQERPRP